MFVSALRCSIAAVAFGILSLPVTALAGPESGPPQGNGRAGPRPDGVEFIPPAAAPAAEAPRAAAEKPAAAPAAPAAPEKPAASARDEEKQKSFWKPSSEALAAERRSNEQRDAREVGTDDVSDKADGIAPLLAQHPDSSVVICMAGCGPQPTIVQVVARGEESSVSNVGEMSQNAAGETGAKSPAAGAVICIAGCKGKRGEIIFKSTRLSWLTGGQSAELKDAIRRIAERVAAGEQPPAAEMRAFVSGAARAALTGDATVARASLRQGVIE